MLTVRKGCARKIKGIALELLEPFKKKHESSCRLPEEALGVAMISINKWICTIAKYIELYTKNGCILYM